MTTYEFKQQENTKIANMVKHLQRFCFLVAIGGLLALINPARGLMQGGGLMEQFAGIVRGLILIVLAIVIYRPLDNFDKIVKTKGNDISELMVAVDELRVGFTIMVGLVAINLISVALQIIGLMG